MQSQKNNAAPDTLITTYLEMISSGDFRPGFIRADHFQIFTLQNADVEFYRFLYRSVGEKWRWRDRLVMPDADLEAVLASPFVTVEVLYAAGAPAGYVELARQEESTEIAYFGLRESYMGRGYGKHLLSHGIARAWEDGAQRVWVHTCNLDGPHALDNYLKRGFKIYDQQHEPMPEAYT